jgi:hypothetical protein
MCAQEQCRKESRANRKHLDKLKGRIERGEDVSEQQMNDLLRRGNELLQKANHLARDMEFLEHAKLDHAEFSGKEEIR